MNILKRFGKFNRQTSKFDRQTKIIIGGTSILGASAGVMCAYIYCIIESIVVSK